MRKNQIKKVGIILAALMLASGCSNANEVNQSNQTNIETGSVQQEMDQSQSKSAVAESMKAVVESETYTFESEKISIDLNLPVVKIGNATDLDGTRVLQKPFKDEINRAMTDADYWSAREEAYEPRTLTGRFEVIYEDEDIVSILPQINENNWMTAVTLQKKFGSELGFKNLPNSELFWNRMNKISLEKGLESISIESRPMVFGQFYVTESDLVFNIPEWYRGESGIGKLEIPLEVLEIQRGDLLVEYETVVNVGSKQYKVSLPYYTFAGEVPIFTSESDPKLAIELSEFMETQIVMNQKLIEDDAKSVAESNKEDGFTYPPEIHNVQFDVKRNDSSYLSTYITYYSYTGGAHGNHYDVVYTFDTETGKMVELKDLFRENIDYIEQINGQINEQISKIQEEYREDQDNQEGDWVPYMGFETIAENQNFYLTNDSLVIFFDLYEIAPYASGIPTFEIPFSKLESVMKL